MSENKQLSFVVDRETFELINQLKKDLKAPTAAAVFRKALAIAKVATEHGKQSGGVVTLRGRTELPEEETSIALTA